MHVPHVQRLLVALVLLLSACAHHSGPVRQIELEPLRLEVVRDAAGAHVEAYDAATLFEQASRDLKLERYAEAAAAYDRLLGEFSGSRYGRPALYNAGLAYEGLRRYADAAARYRRLISSAAPAEGQQDAQDARFRLGVCLAELGQHRESLAVFDELLARPGLLLGDRVEALTRRGRAQLELGQLEEAERTFRDTAAIFKDDPAAAQLDADYYLALCQFHLAQVPHRMLRALPLRLPQQRLEEDIEAKARLFLQAQGRYIDTIKLQNPVWATAAGFQIGALYREMYDMLLGAPVPEELDSDEKRAVYRDMLKGKLRVLLEKARRIHEKNALMAERLGARTEWAQRSSAQLEELERLLEQPAATP